MESTWQHLLFSLLHALPNFQFPSSVTTFLAEVLKSWPQSGTWREVVKVLCGLSFLAPLQFSTHGYSPGIAPLFGSHIGRCLELGAGCSWRQYLFYHPGGTFPFFTGMLYSVLVLSLEIDPIATMSKDPFLGLWHVFNVFSICFMLMLLFSFAYENTKRRTEGRFRWFSSLFSPKYKGHYSQ